MIFFVSKCFSYKDQIEELFTPTVSFCLFLTHNILNFLIIFNLLTATYSTFGRHDVAYLCWQYHWLPSQSITQWMNHLVTNKVNKITLTFYVCMTPKMYTYMGQQILRQLAGFVVCHRETMCHQQLLLTELRTTPSPLHPILKLLDMVMFKCGRFSDCCWCCCIGYHKFGKCNCQH